mgnify:CR=1 FL=1
MSILNDLVRDVASLLFPPRCAVCGEPLTRGERTVCTLCRATAPLTGYWREADNPVVRRCWGMVPVCQASGFLFFVRASGWRRLIHGFKYRGAWRTAREMGAWYGRHLRESGLYDDVEVVVPLPLHPFRRCRRGYNQSEYLAEGIASQLGVGVDRRSVRRITRFDVLDLQHRLPRRLLQLPYDLLNRLNHRKLLRQNTDLTTSIRMDDYRIGPVGADCFDLFYIATK